RADALQVYTDTRRVMVDELGIEPGAELRDLHHRLLAVDEPQPRQPAQQPATPPAQPSRRPIVPFLDEPLPAPISPAQLPADVAERAAMYRSVLASRRVLVVLDDAADAAQIQHLLPGSATCAVLVTSRRRLPEMQWDEQAELEGMSREEALTLFSRTIGAER